MAGSETPLMKVIVLLWGWMKDIERFLYC